MNDPLLDFRRDGVSCGGTGSATSKIWEDFSMDSLTDFSIESSFGRSDCGTCNSSSICSKARFMARVSKSRPGIGRTVPLETDGDRERGDKPALLGGGWAQGVCFMGIGAFSGLVERPRFPLSSDTRDQWSEASAGRTKGLSFCRILNMSNDVNEQGLQQVWCYLALLTVTSTQTTRHASGVS